MAVIGALALWQGRLHLLRTFGYDTTLSSEPLSIYNNIVLKETKRESLRFPWMMSATIMRPMAAVLAGQPVLLAKVLMVSRGISLMRITQLKGSEPYPSR